MAKSKHPMQRIYKDDSGVHRFVENKIVSFLLDNGGYDMNKIRVMDFSNEDREQFLQLIGYSVWGYTDVSYVSYNSKLKAKKKSKKLSEKGCEK